MIKLCYKEYEWKASNEACKTFFDRTGLDLQTVFGDYIAACMSMPEGTGLFEQMQIYAKLYSRKTASIALHSIIKAVEKSIPIDEIYDATYKVGWVISDRPDDLSEPWPFVMLNAALEINEYFNANVPKKKEADIKGG
jgi:hypothetical protein